MGAHVFLRSPVSLPFYPSNVGGALLGEQGIYLLPFPSKHMMFFIHEYGPTYIAWSMRGLNGHPYMDNFMATTMGEGEKQMESLYGLTTFI